ncbi:MAG: glycosyltransferase family 2 protein [Bryobacterales bacterium]|nr:glycosyltransferase family 2 protein [Bryobacterales bacterium]
MISSASIENHVPNSNAAKRPKISVAIPCRNEEKHIARCVDSFLQGTVREIEVIVVDSASQDRSVAVLEQIAERDSRLRIVSNPGRITPRAFNLGIQAARGQYVCIYGGHSIPANDWAEKNLAAIEAHPEAAAVGGVLDTVSDTFVGKAVAAVQSCLFGVGNVRFRIGGSPGFVDTVVYGCYRREVFDKYGYFDEQFTTNQDDELNLRLTAGGEKLWFDPAIRTTYFARPSWRKALDQYWRYGKFKFDTFRKNGRIGAARHLAPAAFVAFLAAWIGGGIFSPDILKAGSALFAVYLLLGLYYTLKGWPRFGSSMILFLPVALSVHVAYGLGAWYGAIRSFLKGADLSGHRPATPGVP